MNDKKLPKKFIIGMLYLLPTKGKPRYPGDKKFLDHVEVSSKTI